MKLLVLVIVAMVACCGMPVRSEDQIADIRQGTNLALTLSPDGKTIVVDLLGQLWKLPATGGAAEPLTPAGEAARNPRYSPSGREVVYQRRIGEQWDLWLLDLESGATRALTTTPSNEREPDFGADARTVVFAADRTGHYCLWQIDIAEGVLTQLTEEPGDAAFPSVSQFGQIAYVRSQPGQFSLRVLNTNGAATDLITTDRPLAAPSWRPGGGVLVFAEAETAESSVLKMLLLSEPPVIKPLTRDEDLFNVRPSWSSAGEFVYSADGQLWRRGIAEATRHPVHLFAAVAVETRPPPAQMPALDAAVEQPALGIGKIARTTDGRRGVFSALGDLWLLERGKLERLTDDAFVEIDPTFSPDGESIVFAGDRTGAMNLWRLMLANRQAVQLTFEATNAFAPAFSPEGRRLAFLEADGVGPWAPSRLRLLDLGRSTTIETLAEDLTDAAEPQWEGAGQALTVLTAQGTLRRFDSATGQESPRAQIFVESAAATNEPAADPLRIEEPLKFTPARAPEAYVVQVGRLFDGLHGDYRRHVDIHVDGGRIVAIASRGTRPLPAKVIDARDATVIPGLIDMHVHQSALAGERLGRAWLAYGVTTVRELASNVPEALERGEAWASGRRLGPRLVVTPVGTVALPPPSGAVPVAAYPSLADGLAHSLSRQTREARFPGASVAGNPFKLPAASGSPYELEVSPKYASYQDGVSSVVTSGTVTSSALAAARRLLSPRDFHSDVGFEAVFDGDPGRWSGGRLASNPDGLQQTIARLIRAGGRVAIGTDAPAVPYGLGVHGELALLTQAGIPNDQALRIASAEGAIALGLEQQIGTLEDGKLADFVVLTGDPLARIADSLTITAVVKAGIWHDRVDLLAGP
jgi:Tol biopolymer transport system component